MSLNPYKKVTYTSTNPLEIKSVAEFLHISDERAKNFLNRTSIEQREENLQRFEELKKLEPSEAEIEEHIKFNNTLSSRHQPYWDENIKEFVKKLLDLKSGS